MSFTEQEVEQIAVDWFRDLGYDYASGLDIAPDGAAPERKTYADVHLEGRFRSALARINPHLPAEALEDVARRVLRPASPSIEENNHAFRRMLTRGVEVQVRGHDGVRGDHAWVVDYADPGKNDWLVVNQLTVVDGKHNRRPDLVVYLNGLPVAVVELKNPGDPNATLQGAWHQLQTYKIQIPRLFDTNEFLVVSDGAEARIGSLSVRGTLCKGDVSAKAL